MLFALFAAAALAASQQPDTTVNVERGQRLSVEVHGGSITVRTWDRSAVRIRASNMSVRGNLEVDADGSDVSVEVTGRHGTPTTADIEVTMPAWMPVSLEGVYTDLTVVGSQAAVSAETVQGNIDVRGGREDVELQTVEGSIVLAGAQGRLSVESVNNSVTVNDAKGELHAETVNGPITLGKVDLASLDLSTVNGDVAFQGPLHDDGRYVLTTHNGQLELRIDNRPNATFSVSTFGGELESDFPITTSTERNRRGKRFSFTVGNGSARVELESFNGRITLRQSGTATRSR